MSPDKNSSRSGGFFQGRRRKIIFVASAGALGFIVFLFVLAHHAEPLLRRYVIETLTARFKTPVELADLRVFVTGGLEVSGKGLKIYGLSDPNIHRVGVQPIIGVESFRFHVGVLSLLRSPVHVQNVFLRGLVINIPPAAQRKELKAKDWGDLGPDSDETENQTSAESHDNNGTTTREQAAAQDANGSNKIKIVVDTFRAKEAQLIINTNREDKLPLDFDIQDLTMRDIGMGQPLHFHATLLNPKPIGNIDSTGEFGPFNSDSPRETPVRGDYKFSHADLGTLKGISGILSSTGRYQGSLGEIVVDGTTDTPDFQLKTGGSAVPLKTTFHAIVDGTTGDTYLEPVEARLSTTAFTARGFVVKVKEPRGHHIKLQVKMPQGRIEDLLRMAVRTNPPVMTGAVSLETQLDLPPGAGDITDRLRLKGKFLIAGAHFTNDKIQGKVDQLSMRSQGKMAEATDGIPDNVKATMRGDFVLQNSTLELSRLRFQVPGTEVNLAGIYSLDGNTFDLHGQMRVDAKLSQMVKGWKSVLLKPMDPFFRKQGMTQLPIKISGTKSEPHFGLDLFHDHGTEEAREH